MPDPEEKWTPPPPLAAEEAVAAAEEEEEEEIEADEPPPALCAPSWVIWVMKVMSKRRTWVALFLLVYSILLSSSWRLLLSVRSWYSAAVGSSPSSSPWPALYASVLCGGVFGLLAMAAALALAVPAMVTTWITVLVLLAFAGKPRRALVREGRRITADIAGTAFRVLVREGNLVAAACAVISFAALLRRRGGEVGGTGTGTTDGGADLYL